MDLAQLERAFDVFGAMDPGTLPFHHAQVFLFIAQQESCTYPVSYTHLTLPTIYSV